MLNWSIEQIRLDLKFNWHISRNSSEFKLNHIIKVTDGIYVGRGEVAPNSRYEESNDLINSQFNDIHNSLNTIESIEQLDQLCEDKLIKNSLRFGLNSALIHLICAQKINQLPVIFHYLNLII